LDIQFKYDQNQEEVSLTIFYSESDWQRKAGAFYYQFILS